MQIHKIFTMLKKEQPNILATEMTRKSKIWNEMLLKNPNRVRPEQVRRGRLRRVKNPNRVRPERVQRGRLRRVSKILETRGNFDEVSEIKKSTIFFETSRQKSSQSLPNFFVIESSSKILHRTSYT